MRQRERASGGEERKHREYRDVMLNGKRRVKREQEEGKDRKRNERNQEKRTAEKGRKKLTGMKEGGRWSDFSGLHALLDLSSL